MHSWILLQTFRIKFDPEDNQYISLGMPIVLPISSCSVVHIFSLKVASPAALTAGVNIQFGAAGRYSCHMGMAVQVTLLIYLPGSCVPELYLFMYLF